MSALNGQVKPNPAHVFLSYAGDDRFVGSGSGPAVASYLVFMSSLGVPVFFDQVTIKSSRDNEEHEQSAEENNG